MEVIYCEGCGKNLRKAEILDGFFGEQEMVYDLEGESYCDKCASTIVKNKRSKL